MFMLIACLYLSRLVGIRIHWIEPNSLNQWRTQEAKCAHFCFTSQIAFEIGAQQKGYKPEETDDESTYENSLFIEELILPADIFIR